MVTKRTLFSGGRLPNVRAASLPNAAERGWQPKSALFLGRQKEISQQQLEHTVQVHQLYNFRERLSPWYDADYVFVCVSVWLCVFSRVGASCVGRSTCVCAVWAPLRRVNKYNSWSTARAQRSGVSVHCCGRFCDLCPCRGTLIELCARALGRCSQGSAALCARLACE